MIFDLRPTCDSMPGELTARGLAGTGFEVRVRCVHDGMALAVPEVAVEVALPDFPRCVADTPENAMGRALATLDGMGFRAIAPDPQIGVTTP